MVEGEAILMQFNFAFHNIRLVGLQ